jgi:1-acyl-sn-glycerol-3-phosphate acyltransferase
MFDQDNEPFDEAGLARHIEKALQVNAPGNSLPDISYALLRRMFPTTIIDAGNIPERPCLFVGNHSLFALDGVVMGPIVYNELGRFLRGLGDKFLWNPASEDFLLAQGAVIGDPTVCSAMMEAGRDLLVFPGGAHEATKTTAQKYTLQWKQRYGFARLAAQHGYTIMPFALVGPDEFYSHLLEGEDIPHTAIGRVLTRMGLLNENTRTDMLPPIPRGALGSMIPRPQRCYLQFGKPLDLSAEVGKKPGKKKLQSIRSEVAAQIEDMIGELLLLREQRRGSEGLLRRLLTL